MPQQTINLGTAPNDGTGDPLRDAYDKCNSNFTELYAGLPVPLSQLSQSSATTSQVPAWNGSAWVASTVNTLLTNKTGITFQPIATNYAVGITPGSTASTFLPYDISGTGVDYCNFVLDFTPSACRMSFTQQDVNAANDGEVGFQISASSTFATVLYENYISLGVTKGNKTQYFTLTGITGGTPYYVRWGYRNPTTLPTFNLVGMSLVFY